MSQGVHRDTAAVEELAAELDRIASGYRELDLGRDLDRATTLDLDLALNVALHRARVLDVYPDRDLDHLLARALDRAGNPVRAGEPVRDVEEIDIDIAIHFDLASNLPLDRDRADTLASVLEGHAAQLYGGTRSSSRLTVTARGVKAEAWVLRLMACFLPADERTLFVAETLGNLGDCEHWWQRVDHLVCLAIGTPRLAGMMWHDGW